jgi:hypothetical protein
MQALTNNNGTDLIVVASEIKASVRRGLTLVDVYGSQVRALPHPQMHSNSSSWA